MFSYWKGIKEDEGKDKVRKTEAEKIAAGSERKDFSCVLRDSIRHYVGPSVGPSVRWSVGRSVGHTLAFESFFDNFISNYVNSVNN